MASTISSVQYIDPWGTAAPGTFQTGLQVTTSAPPPNTVLAICLAQDVQLDSAGAVVAGTQLVSAVAPIGAQNCRVVPPSPLASDASYQVWVQWVAPNTTPTWPAAGMLTAAVIASLPAVTGAVVTSTSLAATWAFAPGAGGVAGATLLVFDTAGNYGTYITSAGSSGSTTISPALSPTATYLAWIAAVTPAQPQNQGAFVAPYTTGPFAAPVPFTVASPAVASVAFDGATLTVGWTPPALATGSPIPASTTYTLVVLDGTQVIATYPAAANGAVATLDLPIRGRTIAVAGAVALGPFQGPPGAAQAALLVAPMITRAAIASDGGSVAMSLVAPPALPATAVITAELLQDGQVIASGNATGSPLAVTLTAAFGAGHAYAVRAYATVAAAAPAPALAGPACAPVGLVGAAIAPPTVGYDGNALAIRWSPLEDAALTGYEVAITGAVAQTVTTTETALALPVALAPTQTIAVALRPLSGAGSGRPSSQATYTVPAPTTAVLGACSFDGHTVRATWSPSTGPGLDGYAVTATGQPATGTAITATYRVGRAPEFAFALPSSDQPCLWTIAVAPTVGTYVGTASAAATVFSPVPLLSAVTVASATSATLAWAIGNTTPALTAALVAASARLQLVVTDAGAPIAAQSIAITGASGTTTLAIPASASAALGVVGRIYNGSALGPYGGAIALLTVQPSAVRAAYDGTALAVDWTGVNAGATSHAIVVQPSTGSAIAIAAGATPPVTVPVALALDATWTATVAPAGPNTSGLASSAATVAIPAIAAPVIGQTRYDGGQLTLAWSAASAAPSTTYQVTIAGAGVTQRVGAALSATLAVDLTAGPYTVTVQAMLGASPGPTSAPAPIELALATAPQLATDPIAGTSTLTWTAPSGATSAKARIVVNGEPANELDVAAVSMPLTVPAGAAVAVAVAGVWTSPTVTALGPYAQAFALPATVPAPRSAAWDGAQLAIAWAPVAACTKYVISVLEVGSATVFASAQVAAPATELAMTLPATDPTAQYTVVLQAQLAACVGPPSTALALVLAAPAVGATTFDGRTWTVAVTAPTTTLALTGYDVVVRRDGHSVQTATLPVPAAAQPLALATGAPIDATATYAIDVSARAGAAVGAAATAATVVAAPALVALTATSPTALTVAARPGALPASATLSAVLYTDGIAGTPAQLVAGTAQLALPAGTSYAVAVRAAVGTATGPWSSPAPVIATAPTAITAAIAAGTLTCGFAGDPLATYTVAVASPSGTIAQASVRGLSATLAVAPAAATAYAIAITEVDGLARGVPATLPLVTDGCAISAATIAADLTATVAFAPPANPATLTGVQPILSWGDASLALPVLAATSPATFAIPASVPNGAALALRAIAGTATGPIGSATPVLTTAPTGVTVAYDGATATIAWSGVGSPLVSAYQLTVVVDGVATVLGQATGTTAAFALAADPAKTTAILVRAVAGTTIGAPSAPAPVLALALFLSVGSAMPAIAPRTSLTAAAADLTLYLPNLFATPPPVAQLPVAPPFVMATAAAPFAYQLTIPASSLAWTFTPAARSAVLTAYTTLLTTLAGLTATPIGLRTLQDAIARAMPQTFAETLYYAYGLSAANGYVDLRPGTILRVEYESYQRPTAPAAELGFVDGYVTTGSAQYEVVAFNANGGWLAGLDAFLATITSSLGVTVHGMPPDGGGRSQGGGGVIDAFFPQFQQPYVRLVYPPSILDQNTPGSGYSYLNPALIAAANLTDLDAGTTNLRNGVLPGGSVAVCYFRGRTTLIASIRIVVNGVSTVVPLGTTIGNVLAGVGARPPITGLALRGVTLQRPTGAAITDPTIGQTGYAIGGGWDVRLDWAAGVVAYGPTSDWLDLPLLGGDRLTFGGRGA